MHSPACPAFDVVAYYQVIHRALFPRFIRFMCACSVFLIALLTTTRAGEQPALNATWDSGAPVLAITGRVGLVVSVQSVTNLDQTNAWAPITNLTLPSRVFNWKDTASPASSTRFYRLQVPPQPQIRGLWADVFHNGLQTAAQIDQMISMAVAGNYNAIFAEVLGYHDNPSGQHGAYWRSDIVPRSPYVTGSFDPLAYMIERAHANGIELHAWLVAFRASTAWPPQGNTFLTSHPEYLMVPRASSGNGPTKIGADYVLDPGSPEVQEYLVSIVRELVTKYEIDGINWDYIRYTQADAGYPADSTYTNSGLARFQRLYNFTGVPTVTNEPAWDEFRRRTIDELIRRVRAELPSIPNARQPLRHTGDLITFGNAPTHFTNSSAYALFSNWESWLRMGWLDAGIPMCYDREFNTSQYLWYRNWVNSCMVWRHDRYMLIGQANYLNQMWDSVAQLQYASDQGANGIVNFSYWSTVDADTNNAPENDFGWYPYVGTNLFTTVVPLPSMPWRNPATATEGTLWGRVTQANSPVDNALVQVGNEPAVVTDGNGYYVVTLLPAFEGGTNYAVTASTTTATNTITAVQVVAGDVRRRDISLGP